jgi:DeoR/GlpR family transcriptional regulator of sugar metabolism
MVLSGKQRKDAILEQLYRKGHILVKDVAAEMGISEATARRDLKAMAGAGEVEVVYGGATLRRGADFSFRSKSSRNVEAKRVIGQLAAGLIRDGDQLFLDSGTTTYEMARLLKGRRGLSVIVNSLRLVEELALVPDVQVIVVGGQYRVDRMDTVGPMAIAALDPLRGYRAFIGADGASMEFGLMASDIDSAHLYRMAVRNAGETVLVADHTKFEAASLYKILDWEAVRTVVTDRAPSPAWREFFNGRGIALVLPPEPAPAAG